MYNTLLDQVRRDYRSGDYSVSYADIAREANCHRQNVYYVFAGRHKSLPVLLAASRLFQRRKAQMIEALATN